MQVTYNTKQGTEFVYDTHTDKVTVTIDPWGQYERKAQFDRREFVLIAKSIELEALKARHAPALTGVPE